MPCLFDHQNEEERERLASIEKAIPFTSYWLDQIGVAAGWHCLEVGAGKGSIAEWVCGRVGPTGKVVAIDLQIELLQEINAPNLEVRQHDITKDELETDQYDLVYARKLLEHLPDHASVLGRMHAATKPGGYLYMEDSDLVSFLRVSGPNPDRFEHAYLKFVEAMASAGFQPELGVQLGDQLRGLGLQDVQVAAMSGEWNAAGDNPVGKVYLMTFRRIRERVTEA